MTTTAITSVDRAAPAGYICSLVDCIADLWKRVYDYACALFAYLFGAPASEPVVLPSGITMLICDYLLMPKQYEDFLYVTKELKTNGLQVQYIFDLKADLLRKAFISIKGVADCFDAPRVLSKIEEVVLSYYYMPPEEAGPDYMQATDLSWVFIRMDDPAFLNERQAEFAKGLEITLEEFPQAIRDWQTIKKIPAIWDAFERVEKGEKVPSIYVQITRAKANTLIKRANG